ncbi:hypothetical protein ISS09_05100 [Candidatus Woesearchaeota archaeon]|nr:hypothetical protein [Candidatus Woesearchaeota archaeon]
MNDNTNLISTGFSIWLMPHGKLKQQLTDQINELSVEYDTPPFEPHITLVGRLEVPEKEAIEKTYSIARNIRHPLEPVTSGIGYSMEQNPFQSVFLFLLPTKDLFRANSIANDYFHRSEDFNLHMSILYGNIPQEQKAEIIVSPIHRDFSFTASDLFLYNTNGPIDQWELVDKFEIR